MSLSTPILTTLSWARAGVRPRPASAMSAAVPRMNMAFMMFLQMSPPRRFSRTKPFAGDRACVPDSPIAVLPAAGNAPLRPSWRHVSLDRRPAVAQVQALFQRVRGQPEFLDALGVVDFAGIDVTELVHGHGMDPVELAGVAAAAAEPADHAAILALQNAYLVVLPVGVQQISLLGIGPDREVPRRAIAERVLLKEPLLHEGAVLLEDLDTVLRAVADIDLAVIGNLDTMHGVPELLLRRPLRIIGRLLVVVRDVAIGTPMPLVGTGRRVEHDDAAIAIAVGDVDFVGLLVDRRLRGLAKLGRVVGALARRDLADLRHVFAVERELQDRVVVVGVAADPDKATLVDLDAVLASDPLIAFAGATPGAQQIAVHVEFQHRRCRHAAFRARRIERCAFLVVGQRARAMDHPDVALPVDGDAADLADDPVVRQRLWPGGVDRKGGDVGGRSDLGKSGERDGRGENGESEASGRAGAMWRRRHEVLPNFSCARLGRLPTVNRGEGRVSIATQPRESSSACASCSRRACRSRSNQVRTSAR